MGEYVLVALATASIFVVSCVWRLLLWGWWRPKKLEKYLREQGINGHSYKFLYGTLKEEMRLLKKVQSKPMSLSHDILPRVAPFVHQSMNNYGKMFLSWFGPIPRVYIIDPVILRDVMSNKNGFQKPKTNPYGKFFANGVATREGEDWAKSRRIINPAFHIEKLKHMLPAFYESCSDLLNNWERLVTLRGQCELDMWTEMKFFTGDAISRAAFGSNYKEGMKIFQLQTEQAALITQASRSLYIPGSRFIPTQRNRRMKEIDSEVRGVLRRIISKRMKERETLEESSKDDLLGILLESNAKEIKECGKSKNAGLSMEEVIEECRLFYFVGQEPNAAFLTWTMVVLSMHQDWQSRAREEVLQMFGENKPNFDELNQLKIVTMVLYEVLRLYPPATMFNRVTCKEMNLGDFTFPDGVWLTMPGIVLHRDPELWGEDADEFNPERFSEGILKASKNQINSFFPFGWGPRICMGQNFSLLEGKMAIAMILQKFWFELSPSYAHAPRIVVTLQPQYGAPIILHKL